MFRQTTFTGFNNLKMQAEYQKLVKRFIKLGNPPKVAEEKAINFIDYYKHTYREYI